MDASSFAVQLAEALQIDVGEHAHPGASLFDDWSLDSLQSFQLIVAVETMADCIVPPPLIPEMYTVADAYAYYLSLTTGAST